MNVMAAKKIGLYAIRFENPAQLAADLSVINAI